MKEHLYPYVNQIFDIVSQHPDKIFVFYANQPPDTISTSELESILFFMKDKKWIIGKYDETGSRPAWLVKLSSNLRWSRLRHGIKPSNMRRSREIRQKLAEQVDNTLTNPFTRVKSIVVSIV
jgi:hypothetical protein